MKKVLLATITLTAIGVAVRVVSNRDKNSSYLLVEEDKLRLKKEYTNIKFTPEGIQLRIDQ